jgi:beta-lactamase superfamily II metal-dependent hydrolase
LVLRLECGAGTVLWAGDAGSSVERALLAIAPGLRADVLVQGEHSAETNLTPEWLAAVRPRVLIRPGRGYQPDKSLSPDFWETARGLEIEVLRLDHTGAVTVDFLPQGPQVRTFLRSAPE